MRVWALVAAMYGALAITSPALACKVLLPGPPEQVAAAFANQQAEMWDEADLVIVARVAQVRTKATPGVQAARQVDLMPLTSLKGQAGSWQFELGYTGTSSCGPMPAFNAIAGQSGEQFVLFFKGDTPMQDAVLLSITAEDLVEPRALAALKAQEGSRSQWYPRLSLRRSINRGFICLR